MCKPILTVALLCLFAGGCVRGASTDLDGSSGNTRVTLALNWFPEAEHGGFFAAQVHGYFREEGLEVKILPGGPGAPVIQQAATQRVDFAIANADQVLLGRDQGAPVVAVMAAMQSSPRCIMIHRKSGIESLLELRNLTLAVGSGKPFAKYLLSRLTDANLTVVPYQGNVTAFLQRDDYAQQAYLFSEPYIARLQGADPRCLMLSEIGFNPYTSVLVTSEKQITDNPQLVAKMVRACVRGWSTYLSAPEQTNRRIQTLNSEMSLDILAFGADAIRPLCVASAEEPDTLGTMSAARWETLANQLHAIDLLENPAVWKDAYDTQFLKSSPLAETPSNVE